MQVDEAAQGKPLRASGAACIFGRTRAWAGGEVVRIHVPLRRVSCCAEVRGASRKVYGTRNVRVVDASVIPLHISAHIQATIYGVAEAGAAIIAGGLSSLR